MPPNPNLVAIANHHRFLSSLLSYPAHPPPRLGISTRICASTPLRSAHLAAAAATMAKVLKRSAPLEDDYYPTNRVVIMDNSGDESVEGSRSRSEEDLGAIGGATRIEDTGASRLKESHHNLVDWDAPEPASSQEDVEEDQEEEEEEVEEDKGNAGVEKVEGLDLKDADMASAESSEELSKSELEEASESVSEQAGTESDVGSAEKSGKEKDKDGKQSTAYSRAFSKIFKSKAAAAESDIGPVLSARQALVAKKLEEEAGERKEKKDTKKEKKELREKAHLYPQSFTDTKERDLMKLATRGVVKLFNAVSKAQKVQAGADGRDAKLVAKQSKSAFLSEMRTSAVTANGRSRGQSLPSTPTMQFGTVQSQEEPTSRWSVVQDGFMVGKNKLKDWDKEEEMGGIEGNQLMANNQMDDYSEDDSSDDD